VSRILRKWEIRLEPAGTTPKGKILVGEKENGAGVLFIQNFRGNKSDLDIPEC
jgi:hypothetical protein